MTQARTWDDLYRFEDYIESAAASILRRQGIATFIQQSTEDLSTPRVELQFTVGGAVEHYNFRESDTQPFIDRWSGNLVAGVVTARSIDRSAHRGIRSKVRRLLAQWESYNTDLLLPYHELVRCIEGSSSPIIRPETDEDVSQITFEIIFGIRDGAWPDTDPDK